MRPLAAARKLACGSLLASLGGGKVDMKRVLINLLREESGQDLIEYALVAAVLALAAVAGMTTLASNISNAFSAVGSKLSSSIA